MQKKKIWASFQKNIELFTQKFVIKLSKIWVWEPEKTYSGSGSSGHKGTGSQVRIRKHWFMFTLKLHTNPANPSNNFLHEACCGL